MKNKILQNKKSSLMMLIVLLVSVVGMKNTYAYTFSATCPTGQTLYYNITDATNHYVEVTYPGSNFWSGFTKPTGDLVIPDMVEYHNIMYSVTNIGYYAFRECSGLTSVSFPNTLITIGGYGAFHDCTGLTTLSFPNSLTTIGNSAFEFCSGLTSVTFPNSLLIIDDCAFNQCDGITSIVIPNSVTSIGNCSFYKLYYLTSLVIGSSVSSIAPNAFRYCTRLNSLTVLAEEPPVLGDNAFGSVPKNIPVSVPCSSLEDYQASAGWNEFTNIHYLVDCPIVFSDANVKALCVANWDANGDGELSYAEAAQVSSIGTIFRDNTTITSFNELQYFTGLTSLVNSAFRGCSNLASVVIPSSVTTINKKAFMYCSSLASIVIPNSVIYVGEQTFYYCSNLTSVALSNSLSTIASSMFQGCSALLTVTIPNSVTTIGGYAFSSCTSLTSIEIPSSVTNISSSAFISCSNLSSISIPNSVVNIGTCAFEGCGFSSIVIPNSITVLADDIFAYCSNLTSVTIPNTITSIGTGTFLGCTNLTTIHIPNTVSSIGSSAFKNCSNLNSIDLPDAITSIELWTFTGCNSLDSITIPGSVASIGSFAFSSCSGLTSITVLSEEPPVLGTPGYNKEVFSGVAKTIPVNVPCESISLYQNASGWIEFTNYQGLGCPSHVISATANPTEGGTVTGTGEYEENTTCTLSATPNVGYSFSNWTESGVVVSTDATYTFMVTGDRTLVANFSETSNASHWTSITGTQFNLTMNGVIYIDGVAQTSTELEIGAFCGDECRGSGRAQFFPPTGDYLVSMMVVSNQQSGETITFRLYDHNIQQEFPSECVNSITFVANTNFGEMYNWYQFAFFNAVAVTAAVTPEGAGTVAGTGDHLLGTPCTLTANANEGYTFINWTVDGEVVSTDNPYTFTVNGVVELTANFSLNSYDITATANPTAGGTVDGTGTYDHFSSCTLTATANTGYAFQSWSVAGDVVSTDNPYTFTVSSSAELTANFGLISYDITATANPTVGGTVDGTGTYDHFSSCTLTATANTGYVFQSWSVAGEVVSTDNPYTFTVSSVVELTANFDAQETSALAEGWTWWSTSIELTGIDGLTMLEESLGHNGLTIKSANKFVQNYYPSTGYDYWFGQLTSDDFHNESSYMIQTSASCEVAMTGTYANPEDHPIQLYPNWTWIGYPCGTQQSTTSAFAGFTPTANDVVKGQYAFSTYYDNFGWFPEFNFVPGGGYLYQSNASDNRTLTFANGSKADPLPYNGEDRYWRSNVHAFTDNMNVIAVVTVNGDELADDGIELGAFVNGECRGSAVLMHFQPTGRWYAMLTVTGEDGDEIVFGVIDRNRGVTNMTSGRSLTFEANAVVGQLDEPYAIDFGTLGCIENGMEEPMHIYPNPIDRNTTFRITLPEAETLSDIYVVNMMGEVVAHETDMNRMLALQMPGVYTVKAVCRSGKVFVGKLVVNK